MARTPPAPRPKKRSAPRPRVLRSGDLFSFPWLAHGFSTRKGGASNAYGKGELNLGATPEDGPAAVEHNRKAFVREVTGGEWPLVGLKQLHSDRIVFIERATGSLPVGDGMVTNVPGLLLAIKTADCLPVLVADPVNCAVGAFHAGWRGTVARIVEKGVGEMRRRFGSDPAQMRAALGPGIHACCYAVGAEVREQFEAQFTYAAELFRMVSDSNVARKKYPLLFMDQRAPGHGDTGPEIHLDLVEANRRQLLAAGLRAENIQASELCTACRTDLLFSHRAEFGKTGRMMAVIGIRKTLGS